MKNKICNNALCYQSKLNYPVYISNQKFKNLMDLLIISDETKSYHVYTKDFNKFMFNKTKRKNTFVSHVYSVLAVKVFW